MVFFFYFVVSLLINCFIYWYFLMAFGCEWVCGSFYFSSSYDYLRSSQRSVRRLTKKNIGKHILMIIMPIIMMLKLMMKDGRWNVLPNWLNTIVLWLCGDYIQTFSIRLFNQTSIVVYRTGHKLMVIKIIAHIISHLMHTSFFAGIICLKIQTFCFLSTLLMLLFCVNQIKNIL